MSTNKQIRYRIETYIIPEENKLPLQHTINEIDDVKIVNQLKMSDQSTSSHNDYMDKICSLEDDSHEPIDAEIVENIINETETMLNNKFTNNNIKYDNNKQACCDFDGYLSSQKSKYQSAIKSQDILYPVKEFKKINSLMTIDERSESCETNSNNFCYHGYKNGCTATISPPERVSEQIFKENWLHKIEMLRQREAVVKDKEMNLQCRERELFKREKEIKMSEKVLMDKLKKIKLHVKQENSIRNTEMKSDEKGRTLETVSSSISKESHKYLKTDKSNNHQINLVEKNTGFNEKERSLTHLMRCPPASSETAVTVNTYSNMKYKQRPKISYDDLDSTLSADIGDSSFVQTSKRFNPAVYKKPYAFARSASERWTRRKSNIMDIQPQKLSDIEEKPHHVEEEKILKRLSVNISASQDKSTKFQHYGLVDCKMDNTAHMQDKMERNPDNERLRSYPNRESEQKFDETNKPKEKRISWNDEANEWLQKKRQAYNQAIQKSLISKENIKNNITEQKIKKTKKKDVKNRFFTVFR